MATKKKTVKIIATGGTIAMERDSDGSLVPARSMDSIIHGAPEIRKLSRKYNLETTDLMNADSSDRDVKDWELIGEKVVEAVNRDDVAGVVITHGTDTMAYSAQYLDYSIKNLRKPVVLTGSQIAASEPDSDGIPNLKDAITVAAEGPFAEVLITFDGETWKAENAIKYKVWEAKAFRGVGRRPICSVTKGKIEKNEFGVPDGKYDTAFPRGVLVSRGAFPKKAVLEKNLFDFEGIEEVIAKPYMNTKKLMKIAKSKETKAIIVYGFGAGNIAERYQPFIEEATKRGKLVVMCSQAEGPVDLLEYGLGRNALEKGALPAGDRRPEEVYMRLAHTLGVMREVEKSMAGDGDFKDMLKYSKVELSTHEVGKYLFLSGTRFKKVGDREKYGALLGVEIRYCDELRHIDVVKEAVQDGIYELMRRKMSHGSENKTSGK